MPSHHDSRQQHPPPIRTVMDDSQKSHSAGSASPEMLSPTSTFSRSSRSLNSPAEVSFFSAITSRIRGRSHSRSRAAASRKRSKSSLVMPPAHFPPTPSTAHHPMSPSYTPSSSRAQQSRGHAAKHSQSSIASTSTKATRPSLQGSSRRSTGSSDMWRGRHSNSWLFNDFSVTEQAKDLLHWRRR